MINETYKSKFFLQNNHQSEINSQTDNTKMEKVKKSGIMKRNKMRKNSDNPTLESLRSIVGDHTPDHLQQSYVPYMIKTIPTLMRDVFKRTTSLLTSLTQISIVATDNPVTCVGEEFRNIQTFKRIHDWPLNETLVAFSYKSLAASDEQDDKTFCMDIAHTS